MKRLVAIAFLFLITLTSCAPFNNAIATRVASTLTALPTFTPYPTYTPYPTNTPLPTLTPTPVFAKWTSNQVIQAFVNSGLEVGSPYPMTKDDYGLAPLVALEGTRFLIPSLCTDCGGRIMSFNNQDDLERVRRYYVELGEASAMFFSWTFVKDNILVQINGSLPETLARMYEDSLNLLK